MTSPNSTPDADPSSNVRYGLLVRTCLEVLRDTDRPMRGREVLEEVATRLELTEAEQRIQKSGEPAWLVAAGFHTGDAATAGWLVKRDGLWWITEAGRTALET